MANYNKKFVRTGFSLIEVTVAMLILAMIGTSVVTVVNRYIDIIIDYQLRTEAFELARENMEQILIQKTVVDAVEFGISDDNYDISWENTIESFYEPVTNRMWMKAVCSASYLDTDGNEQKVELTHWLNALSKKQILAIVAQQAKLEEYEDALNPDDEEKEKDIDPNGNPEIKPEPEKDPLYDKLYERCGPPPGGYTDWQEFADADVGAFISAFLECYSSK